MDPLAQASYERNKKYKDSKIMNKPVEAWEKMKQAQKHKFVAPGDVEEFLLHENKQLIPTSFDKIVLVLVDAVSYR